MPYKTKQEWQSLIAEFEKKAAYHKRPSVGSIPLMQNTLA
jgi:hypothetical protein